MIIHKYRLHIPGTKYWYRVLVFETTRQMNEYYKHSEFKKLIKDEDDGYYWGMVNKWGPEKRIIKRDKRGFGIGKLSNQIGETLLSKERLTANILPHESVHMAAFYMESIQKLAKININGVNGDEEFLAFLAGHLTARLNERFKKYGLYD